ncbi:GAS2-like protein pickled eggs isoform X2 [Drosophila pseudoobscura]|uniref:GAS2-like protein pickled eggs isoform X2 n=1 Tax=Drosophila pseudoobscura pseudoobscura TaxID=46245 RepID=A0A6I8UGS1_DROPS|nr:GAS2-like protein pickled eggs isoform X2 [Drosophila pseudoobscura]XP_033241432.1 GAS2-like protein pickled eggs isoform X2 [Drosophila pseudoobscura]XP_033241433.1 GAS2-like protein pickled eggs isoform X2 [Drosophila pseudoobscura]
MAMLEARPYRPFKSSEEYLEAMKEDLAEWLSTLYPELSINAENFMDRLDTGVALCKHANYVRQAAEDYLARRQARNKSMTRSMTSGLAGPILALGNIHYLPAAKSGTFFARDNVSNFITWCRKSLKIIECLLFETDDLIMRKNEKHVILCLLEVARRGAKFGMLAPMLVQMERQIDREIAADIKANGANSSDSGTQTEAIASSSTISNMATSTTITTTTVGSETDLYDDSDDSENEDDADENPMLMYGPQPQIVTNDLKSLDEMVRDLVEKCTCPSQFPMVRVSEGKYRIGDTKVLIFVRILRSHVMVRVGGGWDTLAHYLDKHDPCRCRAQHRSSVAARLIPRQSPNHNPSNGIELHKAQVIFERSPTAARRVFNSPNCNGGGAGGAGGATAATAATAVGMGIGLGAAQGQAQQNGNSLSPNSGKYRSRSPTPQRKFINGIQSNGIVAVSGSFTTAVVPEQQLLGSPGLARRSMSPSPRRLIDMRKKQSSLDSYSSGPKSLPGGCSCSLEDSGLGGGAVTAPSSGGVLGGGQSVPEQGNSSKFENISDNGSEISDEGYRSLGVNQSSAQKRESLHSQASMEDAETNARLDQTSSDSQISPSEEPPEKAATDILEEEDLNGQELDADADVDVEQDYSVCDGPQSLPAILRLPKMADKFEQSGVFITDDEITVDMAKSPHSPKLEMQQSPALLSKIPRSPLAQRRRSIDNSTCGGAGGSLQDLSFRSSAAPPVGFSRKQPVYRSMRSRTTVASTPTPVPSPRASRQASNLPTVRDVTNTWSGRTTAAPNSCKRRPQCTPESFVAPAPFERSGKGRSSQILYDSNGRRVRGGCTSSLTTSPVKNHASSPLAQQLLEAASSAKNDAQILEKMKTLLSRYAASNQTSSGTVVVAGAGAVAGVGAVKTSSNGKKTPMYEDFTTAWVHSNGNLERSESCSPPAKARSKRSSAASSCESNHSTTVAGVGSGAGAGAVAASVVSPRRERGMSKIPAPVRHHTELY